MVFSDVLFSAFLIGGVALIRWSRVLGDANLAANRAAAESLGVRWMQRLLGKTWMRGFSRAMTVAVGIVWMCVATFALIVVNR